jgi:hypothetical protein
MKRILFLALAVLSLGVAGLSPSTAHAVCEDPPCLPDWEEEETPAPPAPTITTISAISPSFAWSGDTITLTGTGFSGATVSINNQPANVTSATSTRLVVIVPTIMSSVVGPVTIPVVVSSPTGTASTSFTLSPSLQVSTSATFGVNAQFGQGMDGSAWATATLDRSSGVAVSALTVLNKQTWLSLVISMSTVWLDSSGTVIGFTDPKTVSARGWASNWPYTETLADDTFAQVVGTQPGVPNPGVGPFARSARIVLVRNNEQGLLDALRTAVAIGESIASLLSKL